MEYGCAELHSAMMSGCHSAGAPVMLPPAKCANLGDSRPRRQRIRSPRDNYANCNAPSADRNHHSKQRRGRCPKRNCSPARPTPVGSACDPSMTMPTNRQRRRHQAHYVHNRHSPPPCFHLTVPPAPVAKSGLYVFVTYYDHSAKATSPNRLLKFSASTAHRSFPCRTPS